MLIEDSINQLSVGRAVGPPCRQQHKVAALICERGQECALFELRARAAGPSLALALALANRRSQVAASSPFAARRSLASKAAGSWQAGKLIDSLTCSPATSSPN